MADSDLVTCKIYGQIGNQLFQIATTLAYAWDYQATPLFPGLHNPAWNISLNKDRLFSRLDASSPTRPFLNLFTESSWFSSQKIPFRKDQILDGYFQSWKHFHHHRRRLLEVFAPSAFTVNYLKSKYQEIIDNPNTVGIHVRTQCKRTHENGNHPFWGIEYYQRALDHFPKDATFIIFSDRINWCKKHFARLSKNFIYIDGNYGIEDLFLLAKCKHNILCNSSFSWWAAYFNENPDKKVIFPLLWKDPACHENPPPKDFFLPEWTLLDNLRMLPFPTDMLAYDRTSQCIDNNV